MTKMDDLEIQLWLDHYQPCYFFHDGKELLRCDRCDKKIQKDELVIQADAGENYCEKCSTE